MMRVFLVALSCLPVMSSVAFTLSHVLLVTTRTSRGGNHRHDDDHHITTRRHHQRQHHHHQCPPHHNQHGTTTRLRIASSSSSTLGWAMMTKRGALSQESQRKGFFFRPLLLVHADPKSSASTTVTTKMMASTSSSSNNNDNTSATSSIDKVRADRVPLSTDAMIKQVALAMKQASKRGIKRQIIRIMIPRDVDDGRGECLYPPDESWQGGIMQLYRAIAPTCARILRQYCQDISSSTSNLPSRIIEDRTVDDSSVDGVSYFYTEDQLLSCWLQPLQETVEDYIIPAAVSSSNTNRNDETVLVVMNPQWREVDDALDTASKGNGIFSGLASFLGGKGNTLKQLQSTGFVPIYSLEGYVCRGANVRLLQMIDSDWNVFCERDDGETYISVGSCIQRPTYQQVEQMLQNADIGYKFARDMGREPRL